MINASALLSDLQELLKKLEDDIRARCQSQDEVDRPLREQYAAAKTANRTAQAYEVWREEQITQAAVAWILSCVFVRFCEDNALIDPPRLSGPGERRKRAEDEHTLYFQKHPTHSDREYLQWIFGQVAQLPAMKELFDQRHNPLWSLGVSGDGAMLLREFWLKRDAATGMLVHDFSEEVASGQWPVASADKAPGSALTGNWQPTTNNSSDPTRFLGDLYQDLSESARKKYALLQTPIFVEEFILDRTLTPAIREFGFAQVRMIDPTCGSGHFLLGGFHRLFDLWAKHEPSTNVRKLAQNALDQVFGVDLNPYAVAIARFRLLVAALRACGIRRLADAPAFTINLAAGDSLLHGPRLDQRDPDASKGASGRQLFLLGEDPLAFVYETEDAPLLRKILGQQYHAVVGNPPYIVPRDKALNDAYRERFASCHRQYSLAVPFFERFFDLALANGDAGFVGMITANSFMKREFGKKLIEEFLPRWDLSHVIDTSGAYIPGHGTPTVILFGRNRRSSSSTVRAVMGIRGEPTSPEDPAYGLVWSAIVNQIDQPGSQSDFVSVADTARESFHRHPWSIGGGGAAELRELLDGGAERTMGDIIEAICSVTITRCDDAYFFDETTLRRQNIPICNRIVMVEGEHPRDWTIHDPHSAVFPYDQQLEPIPYDKAPAVHRFLWPCKEILWRRIEFGGDHRQLGRTWWEWNRFLRHRFGHPASIVYPLVATHNHFVLTRERWAFNRHAPLIQLPAEASLDQHLWLLGLLNSSVACFWMQQIFHNKGGPGGGCSKDEKWHDFYEFDGTKLKQFPLPASAMEGEGGAGGEAVTEIARQLDELARRYAALLPDAGERVAGAGEVCPGAGERSPRTEESCPCTEESRPCTEESCPCTEESRPCTEESCPCTEESRPCTEESCPCTEESRPCTEESCPCTEERRLDDPETTANTPVTPPKPAFCFSDLPQRRAQAEKVLGVMIALQEELDWLCYGLYGLVGEAELPVVSCQLPEQTAASGPQDSALRTQDSSPPSAISSSSSSPCLRASVVNPLPPIRLGQRAFEIVLARQMVAGEVTTTWFERHGSTPITEVPEDWPEDYKAIVRRRIQVIETNANIRLIEKPEYKRRWNIEPWQEIQERALREWLLDRLEGWPLNSPELKVLSPEQGDSALSTQHSGLKRSSIWDESEPRLMSVAQLADRVRQDADFMRVAALYRGHDNFDITRLVGELVADEAVPALAVLRYKDSGARKRAVWEQVWEMQRQEDAIDARTQLPPTDPQFLSQEQAKKLKREQIGDIPVPPKYTSADMKPGPIWRLRGKLDVPKERFVSFPGCGRSADQTLLITWAGFDHLQQMQAIAAYYMDMKEREGQDAAQREPLLTAMLELLPWVLQWHNDLDPEHGLRMGDYYRDFINDEAREMGKTVDQIRKWTPPAKAGKTKRSTP